MESDIFICIYEEFVVLLQPEREKRSSNVDTTCRYSANYASNLYGGGIRKSQIINIEQ